MNSKFKTRDKIIDVARGLAMLFVCAFHLIYFQEEGLFGSFIREGVWLAIPLFFLISGYVYRLRPHDLPYRIKSLLIPSLKYTLFFIVAGGIYCIIFHSYTFKDICIDAVYTYLRPEFSSMLIKLDMNYWDRLLYDIIGQVWFVWTMIFALPLFYLFVRRTSQSFRNLLIICVIFVAMTFMLYDYSSYISWSLTIVPLYAALMLIGDYFAELNLCERIVKSEKSVNYFAALAAFIIHSVMFSFSGSPRSFMNELGTIGKFSVFTFFVQVFIGGYAFIILCKLLVKIKFVSWFLQLVGRNSLLFMFLHRPLGALFSDIFGTYIKSGPYWTIDNLTAGICIKSILIYILTLICCSIFAMLKERSLYENKIQK